MKMPMWCNKMNNNGFFENNSSAPPSNVRLQGSEPRRELRRPFSSQDQDLATDQGKRVTLYTKRLFFVY